MAKLLYCFPYAYRYAAFMTKKHEQAFAYFLTFRTYATYLHGDRRTTIDPKHNLYNAPKLEHNPKLHHAMQLQCNETPFILTLSQCHTVLNSFRDTAAYFHWEIYAAHIRTNHAHIILNSTISKEKTLMKLKAYATQSLKKKHNELENRKKFWTEHGSTRNIWSAEAAFPALYYVVEQQGMPMALYYNKAMYEAYNPKLYKLMYDL